MDIFERCERELGLSQGIVLDAQEVIPRLVMLTPDGEFMLMVNLGEDTQERHRSLHLLHLLLVHKKASGVIYTEESQGGTAITCSFATQDKSHTCYQIIDKLDGKSTQYEIRFGPVQWVDMVSPALKKLLPEPGEQLNGDEVVLVKLVEKDCVRVPDTRLLA